MDQKPIKLTINFAQLDEAAFALPEQSDFCQTKCLQKGYIADLTFSLIPDSIVLYISNLYSFKSPEISLQTNV